MLSNLFWKIVPSMGKFWSFLAEAYNISCCQFFNERHAFFSKLCRVVSYKGTGPSAHVYVKNDSIIALLLTVM